MNLLVLVHNGVFVDTRLLDKGIYARNLPCIYEEGTTIEMIIQQGKTMQDITGDKFITDEYFKNLKQCSLEPYNLIKV